MYSHSDKKMYRTYNHKTPESNNLRAECFTGPCTIYHDGEERREALIELGESSNYWPNLNLASYLDDGHPSTDEESIYAVNNILQIAFEEQDNPKTVKIAFVVRIVKDIRKMVAVMKELQRRVKKEEAIPQSILDHIARTGQFQDTVDCYWPSNWMTYVFLSGHMRKDTFPPEGLWFLPNVERLFLDCYNMNKVPDLIGRFQQLKVVSFAYNKLRQLPTRMRFCKQLEELSVVQNHMNCLPKWLTKFQNFRHLRRTDMFVIQTSDLVPIRETINEDENNNFIEKNEEDIVFSPESLFLLASKAALKAHPCLGFPTSKTDVLDMLPRSVLDALTFFVKDMKFCDHCDKPFFKEKYEVIRKNLKELHGYCHVPIEAVACSDVCADAIVEEWTLLHEEEEKVQQEVCFDVEGAGQVLKKQRKYRKELRKQQRKEGGRNKFLCFS